MTPERWSTRSRSGLRGRGGAGFPTGLKWKFAAKTEGDKKYILCNADEGDPGAFMDRTVLEGDPHASSRAWSSAPTPSAPRKASSTAGRVPAGRRAAAVSPSTRLPGATACWARTSWAPASSSTSRSAGLRRLRLRRRDRPHALHRGQARRAAPRPPFPAQSRACGTSRPCSTTWRRFANIAPIILKGAEWFRSTGTEKSKGTKVFALAGAVKNVGLVEVDIGVQLGEIVYEIGGGIPGGKEFKAVQLGGPSGGCIPRQHLNVPVDYETLQELGAIMGSGGFIVMDDDSCMVDVARFFLDFIQDESCGKCPPCRVGTKRMLEIVTRICNGEGEEGDIETLDRPGQHHQGHRALRPRPDGAQPGALHHPPLPPRVRGPHQGPLLRSRRLLRPCSSPSAPTPARPS